MKIREIGKRAEQKASRLLGKVVVGMDGNAVQNTWSFGVQC